MGTMTIYEMTPTQRVYHRRKAAGLCVRCGKAPPWGGASTCGPCTRKYRKLAASADPDGEKRRARRRSLWQRRREQGLCVECGKPAIDGQARCQYHQMMHRERTHVRNIRARMGRAGNADGT